MALKDILARARKPTPSASMEAASQRAGAPALSSLAPPGEFRKGLRRGAAGLESSLYGVADLAGSVTDHPELQHWAQQGMADAAQVEAENEAKVKSITDVHSLSDVMDWALGKGGEAAPALASMAVAGGVGAKVGEGLVGEAAAGSTERQLAAHGLRRAAAERTGALAGGYASAAVPAVGGTFEDIEQKTGQEAPLTSLGAGAIEGAVAFAPEAWLARKFVPALGGTLEHTGRDILREIGYQTAAQGAAGAGQEAIAAGARKLVDPTESLTSPENIKRYEEGAATGALLGATTAGAVSGGAHILGRALSRVSDPKDHQG
ncbi:MAG TPA: hypothetical protein VKA48_09230, partial [Gammaproteobacteria bacterium]|nr:hypothetical protein [Gammaproteobacteria bacterium]